MPGRTAGVTNSMIRNGLYHITVEMLDGIQGGNQGVMVLRDGTMRGGDSFFYAFGTYTSADGKWKGEVTNQEHSPTFGERPIWERKVVTIGFTGTYTDETAEGDGMGSPASRASGLNPGCGCWFRTEGLTAG
jgi:hypothetical protein